MYFSHSIDFFALPNLKKKYEFIRYGFSLVWVLWSISLNIYDAS